MPALVHRQNISEAMQEALRRHIVREREKRKQEKAEAEKDFERRLREEEEKRKKQEEETVSLEEVKEQLSQLKEKVEFLKREKHRHFTQFKKVLHEEEKRKSKFRDQNEIHHTTFPQQGTSMSMHHMIPQAGRFQTNHQIPQAYIPGSHVASSTSQIMHQRTPLISSSNRISQGLKRPHSPSSPQSNISMYVRQSQLQLQQKQDSFQINQPAAFLSQSPNSHSLSSHFSSQFVGQKSTKVPHGTLASNQHQLSSLHGKQEFAGSLLSSKQVPGSAYNLSISKQLELASQQSGFGEDSLNVRQRMRVLPQPLMQAQVQNPFGSHVRSSSPGNIQIKSEKGPSPAPSHNQPGVKYFIG